ncbi:MAG TPA: SpoIID/LytB domain-containing protein [Anaerolineae bacterium]|nr:SpoIID/LytB domain-containing protein [Anaerolineae bacterium]
MTNKLLLRLKIILSVCLLILLAVWQGFSHPADAQAPPADLQLLAWSPGGAFLLGTTPGQVITLANGSSQLSQVIWQIPTNGDPARRLAEGLAPQLSPDGRWLVFTPLNAPDPATRIAIDVATGATGPVEVGLLATPDLSLPGDPAGRVYRSPDGTKRAILVNQFFQAELWVGEANQPAELKLRREGELFSDLSWSPDGQSVALIITPLGSQVDTAGELWRVDLGDGGARQLSQNNAVDRSPVWRADGRELAVVRNEAWVIVPADELVSETFAVDEAASISPANAPIGAQAQLTPPATIRVIHHASNTCRSVPEGQIDTIPFEDYVKRVVPNEVYPSWPVETLRAQAVAARTYGWDKYLQNPGGSYHVTDWVNNQYMCDTTVPSTNQAVDDTTGEYLAYNGQIITAMFSAENSSPTKTNSNVNYLQAVDDPVSFGQTRNGHGYGMGQWGAQRWADQHGWSYQAILRHYYSGVTVEQPGGGDTAPKVALVWPWSNHYLTGNRLYLQLNTSDNSGVINATKVYLSTPTETNLLIDEAGPADSAGYVVDVSSWLDQALVGQTLVLTAETFDGGGQRAVSPEVVIGLDRLDPTGLLTTTTTTTGSTIITDSPVVSLTLTAEDATAGATNLALGDQAWIWEETDFTREEVSGQPVGEFVSDGAAWDGQALRATVVDDPGGSWQSSNITLSAQQAYRAYVRLKVSSAELADEVVRLEMIDQEDDALIGLRRLRGVDFRADDLYQEFPIDFDTSTGVSGAIALRVTFLDSADVSLDRFVVLTYPTALTSSPSYSSSNFRMKVIDGAGNVSGDLVVKPGYGIYLPVTIK